MTIMLAYLQLQNYIENKNIENSDYKYVYGKILSMHFMFK